MANIAGEVMLSAGIRRYFLAILAGIIGSFSMPSGDFLIAAFVSFTLLVWLLYGISSIRGMSVSINGVGSSFFGGMVIWCWILSNWILVDKGGNNRAN